MLAAVVFLGEDSASGISRCVDLEEEGLGRVGLLEVRV